LAILTSSEKIAIQTEIQNILTKYQKIAAIADRLSTARQAVVQISDAVE
jgi:hypothetical protein